VTEALNPRPEDTAARLSRLDLTVEDVLGPVRAGVLARRTATASHPRAYGGWLEYGERTAALREGLAPRGWLPAELDGMCLVVHPEGRLAVMTALGNAGTGTNGEVTTRRARGVVTSQVVRVNAQLELELDLASPAPATAPSRPTWVLLVHVEGDEVRSELSLPGSFSEEGYPGGWLDRIPLPTLRLNDLYDEHAADEDGWEDGGHDFDVPEL
jgi:hypothetical protein